MLEIRKSVDDELVGHAAPGIPLPGLYEGTEYIFVTGTFECNLYVDDIHFPHTKTHQVVWRPTLYAGRVKVEVEPTYGEIVQYFLTIGPQASKASDGQFDAMVQSIRVFEQTLMSGLSSTTMSFGHEGREGLFADDVRLSRLRAYGPKFLDAVEGISRWPHRALSADAQVLPLSRVKHLHPSALQDRRIAAIARGAFTSAEDLESLQIRSRTSTPTFDTPANRTLLALVRRFQAQLNDSVERVTSGSLRGDKAEQALRVSRRQGTLELLSARATRLLRGPPFNELKTSSTTSAGLTQIAANPHYSRAYRFGSRALNTGVEGVGEDELHVNYTWGIYELWCFVAVLKALESTTGVELTRIASTAATSDLIFGANIGPGKALEVHLQPKFPALSPSAGKRCWSISRERYPDILLIETSAAGERAMVLDAKWRSGRQNVLEAMESAHIYHDALRVQGGLPSPCLLLLPGPADVPELTEPEYIKRHGVGAIHEFGIDGQGIAVLEAHLMSWLSHSLATQQVHDF
jgi:hypothetical protein